MGEGYASQEMGYIDLQVYMHVYISMIFLKDVIFCLTGG